MAKGLKICQEPMDVLKQMGPWEAHRSTMPLLSKMSYTSRGFTGVYKVGHEVFTAPHSPSSWDRRLTHVQVCNSMQGLQGFWPPAPTLCRLV